MSTIKFNLPDFTTGFRIYEGLLEFKQNYPKVFRDGVEISSIFGNFNGNIWNGGSTYFGKRQLSCNEIDKVVEFYNSRGVSLRLTCTNPMLEQTDIYDRYANAIVKCLHNGINEIVVTSPILEDYLRDKYPNFKFVKSIIGSYEENIDVSLDDKYYMSCIKRIRNNNFEYLDKIPFEFRNKVEFLCNDPCPEVCPRLKTHYRQMGKSQLEARYSGAIGCSFYPLRDVLPNTFKMCLKTSISYENIVENYLPRGFCNFKLSGRFNLPVIITNILQWLIEPEYCYDVLDGLLHKVLVH